MPTSTSKLTRPTARRAAKQAAASAVVCRKQVRTCTHKNRNCRQKTSNRFQHRNQQYSIIALTNGTGAIAERYAYSAYGEPVFTNASGTVITDSAKDNRYTYTGREWDEEINLYHFRARMYDAESGRFCGRDPLGLKAGELEYSAYFGIDKVDPFGLDAFEPNRQITGIEIRKRYKYKYKYEYNGESPLIHRDEEGNCLATYVYDESVSTLQELAAWEHYRFSDPAEYLVLKAEVDRLRSLAEMHSNISNGLWVVSGLYAVQAAFFCGVAPGSPMCWYYLVQTGVASAAAGAEALVANMYDRLANEKEAVLNSGSTLTWRNGEKLLWTAEGNWSAWNPTGAVKTNSVRISQIYCNCGALGQLMYGNGTPPPNWTTQESDWSEWEQHTWTPSS